MARNYSELKTKNHHLQATLTASITRSKRGVNILYNHELSKCAVVLAKCPYRTVIWDLGQWVSSAPETRLLQSKYWASWLAAIRSKQITVLPVSPHLSCSYFSTPPVRQSHSRWVRSCAGEGVAERVTHLLRVNIMYCIARVRSWLLWREGGVN